MNSTSLERILHSTYFITIFLSKVHNPNNDEIKTKLWISRSRFVTLEDGEGMLTKLMGYLLKMYWWVHLQLPYPEKQKAAIAGFFFYIHAHRLTITTT